MAGDPPRFEDRPPAKVNLTLQVIGRRPDGFHELRSIFLRIGLTDRLTMAPASTGDVDRLTVTGLPGAPSTRDNLVLRALHALRGHAGIDLPPLDVTLDKRIPAAAGLGGGSSDAASALHLAQAAWNFHLAPDEEVDLAASLGSDVPFFYSGRTAALVFGRGDGVSWFPSSRIEDLGLLLVTPSIQLATARVFARHDEIAQQEEPGAGSSVNEDLSAILEDEPMVDDIVEMAGRLRDENDLWLAAASLEPALPAIRDALESASARRWLMSGSGSTLFALYASASEAAEAGQALVAARIPSLANALINAVDLVGPEPVWRYP